MCSDSVERDVRCRPLRLNRVRQHTSQRCKRASLAEGIHHVSLAGRITAPMALCPSPTAQPYCFPHFRQRHCQISPLRFGFCFFLGKVNKCAVEKSPKSGKIKINESVLRSGAERNGGKQIRAPRQAAVGALRNAAHSRYFTGERPNGLDVCILTRL